MVVLDKSGNFYGITLEKRSLEAFTKPEFATICIYSFSKAGYLDLLLEHVNMPFSTIGWVGRMRKILGHKTPIPKRIC